MAPGESDALLLIMLAAAFVAGWYGERCRAAWGRRRWRRGKVSWIPNARVAPLRASKPGAITDATEQLRHVMDATFEKRRLLSRSEARVFFAAEKAVRQQKLDWRVMAQVSLGEVLSSPDPRAYSAVNSKRVDVLLVSRHGDPIAAVEFQGDGHYQGTAIRGPPPRGTP